MIYLDHASTTEPLMRVGSVVQYATDEYWGNPNSIHSHGLKTKALISSADSVVKDFLKTTKGSVIWTNGASDANARIIQTLITEGLFVTTQIEHKSIDQFRLKGGTIWPTQEANEFEITCKNLRQAISKHTRLCSMMMVNNELGIELPIGTYSRYLHYEHKNLIFHSDITAAVTKVDIDVDWLDLDAVSFSGHKLYGPKGVGCLWVKDKELADKIKNFQYHGTPNVVGILGMKEALQEFNLADEKSLTNEQSTVFLEGLEGLEYQVLGNPLMRHNSTLSIYFPDIDAVTLVMELSDRGVMCSHGSACSSKEATRVLEAFGYSKEVAMCTVRFSFGQSVNIEQVVEAAKIVKETVKELQDASYTE